MTEQKNALAQLFAACWKDCKARFMSDPKAVLAEYGMSVPEGINVKVVENSDSHVHITLPAKPSEDLSDEELSNAAGGSWELVVSMDPMSVADASHLSAD